MALKMAMQRSTRVNVAGMLEFRWTHAVALPPLLDGLPPLILPEFDRWPVENPGNKGDNSFGVTSFSFGGFMELMAVPKRKTSPHKRGIRNGPKALKPTPVIIRCKSCGRVKLPHFYCCRGDRGQPGERDYSNC